MGTETASRTFIGSILCVDLVGYSKRSIEFQSSIKAQFTRLLSASLKGIALEDRIILDTGDGAAVSFLGDPEACLAVATKMRDVMNSAAEKLGCAKGEGPVRIAINLGPVRIAVDMNGHPNIIGDGINVAERIVGFAQPGQIVVSRSFHDMVSRISDQQAKRFHYEGVRTDKNAREHEIYSVEPLKPAKPAAPPATLSAAERSQPLGSAEPSAVALFLRDRRKVGIAAGVLIALIALEGVMLARKHAPAPETAASAPPPAVSTPAPEKPKQIAKAPAAEPKPAPPPPLVLKPAETKAVPVPETKAPPPSIAVKPAETKPAAPPPAATKPAEPKLAFPQPEPKAVEPKKAPEVKPPPPAPEKKGVETRKSDDAPRVIPPPRTPPAQMAPTPQTAPMTPPTEATPAVREEPKPAPAPVAQPTTTANPVSRAPVNFPVAAVNRGIERGTVRARLSINAAGGVKSVTVLSSDPPRVFDREAIRSLEEWRFNPGADNRTYEIEIDFKR